MTQTNATPELPLHLRLPAFRIDYAAGQFANSQSGEIEQSLTGVILAYREDRALWPNLNDPNPTPVCVNGSKFGPCYTCPHLTWGRDGSPPTCTPELTILLQLTEGSVATLTARRSMMRPIDQYLNMCSLLGTELHAQRVTLSLTPNVSEIQGQPPFHSLRLMPGEYVERAELERLAVIAGKVGDQFTNGALS